MKSIRKLFGGLGLRWKHILLFAVAAGVYTGIMALLPGAKDTSFADITISFEVWILFGILIIMNSASPLDSGLKCFVFFLISQPLVYLVQVPFSALGWGLFGYYRTWFIWTLLTFPMGFVGHWMKRGKWWGLLILTPALLFLGVHYAGFFGKARYWFPRHALSALFCAATGLLYPAGIFEDRKLRRVGLILSALILLGATAMSLARPAVYETDVLMSGGSAGAEFDDSFRAALADGRFGDVRITYNSAVESYLVHASFVRGGTTDLILTAPDGGETVYGLSIGYDSFTVSRK